MVFTSMLAYQLDGKERRNAELCLWRLLRQIDEEDIFVVPEMVWQDRYKAWSLKPSVIYAASHLSRDWTCWVDADIYFDDEFVYELKRWLSQFDYNEAIFAGTTVHEEQYFKDNTMKIIKEQGWDGSQLRLYFSTSMFIASRGAQRFLSEWVNICQDLTRRNVWVPDEMSLCYLVNYSKHKDDIRCVEIPTHIHAIDIYGHDVTKASAVSLSSLLAPTQWHIMAHKTND